MLTWHKADVDIVHVERIDRSGKQLLKNVRFIFLLDYLISKMMRDLSFKFSMGGP